MRKAGVATLLGLAVFVFVCAGGLASSTKHGHTARQTKDEAIRANDVKLSPEAARQIDALEQEKESRTPAQ